jgi:hypothetical protein
MGNFLPLAALAFLLLISGCASTPENAGAHSRFIHTKVDFMPIERAERDRMLQLEKKVLETKVAGLQQELITVRKDRLERYELIKHDFAKCENQKNCISGLAHADVKQFERYNDLNKSLHEFDLRIITIEAEIKDWQNRFALRSRAINNRYLVGDFLKIPAEHPEVTQVSVHSLEAFDTRKAISYRLLQFSDVDVTAYTWGDLDFKMLKRPIDEAAVIAAFDVRVGTGLDSHFVISFLVNSYQEDPLQYDKGFYRTWAKTLTEPKQESLIQRVLCSIYSIASPTLAPKLATVKARNCAEERTRMQALSTENFNDRFAPEDWLLPIGFYRVPAEAQYD